MEASNNHVHLNNMKITKSGKQNNSTLLTKTTKGTF